MIMVLGDEPPEPYDQPRGTCPVCGSGQVIHHPLGGPDPRLTEEDPPWVHWQGCLLVFSDRTCEGCGAGWNMERDEEDDEE